MSPTAEQIAWLFVSQYFKRLHSDPSELHHFYDVDAKLLHGKEQDDAQAVSGTESIQERISELHTQGCKTLISCLDAMEGPNKSILIQIIGQMSDSDDGVPQKFVQSVVLEAKSGGTTYSIYSDVFRFLKDDDEDVAKEDAPKDEPKKEAKKEVKKEAEPKKEAPVEAKKEEPKKEAPVEPAPKKETPSAPAAAPSAPAAETKEEPKKETPAASASPAAAAVSPAAPAAQASPAAAPAAPTEPAKPSGPISWAARARSSDKPAPAGSAAPAETPSPVAAAAVAKKEPSSSPTVAAATTSGSSAASAAGQRKGTFHSAYIKGVDASTDMNTVQAALQKIGNGISHFEVTKSKNGVFVDFNDAQTLRKALELREIKVGDVTILIDERKRRKPGAGGSGSNGGGSSAGGSGSSGNRDSNKRQGTKRR